MDQVLGVAIGIATVCLIFSIFASHLQEVWASFSARRASSLEIALKYARRRATDERFFLSPPNPEYFFCCNQNFAYGGQCASRPAPPATFLQ